MPVVFVPRLAQLGAFVNTDGCSAWYGRSLAFYRALRDFTLEDTFQSGHPGVTLMILSGAALVAAGVTRFGHDYESWIRVDLLLYAKLPVALVSGLGILLSYVVLRRCFPRSQLPIVGAFALALDPFFLAHSRYFQLDALVSTFMLVSLLLCFAYLKAPSMPRLVGSALCAGLALLTKSSALALIPFQSVLLVGYGVWTWRSRTPVRLARDVATASLAGVAVFVLAWPAMWVAPIETPRRILAGIGQGVTQTHENVGSLEKGVRGTVEARSERAIAFDPFLVRGLARKTSIVQWSLVALALVVGLAAAVRRERVWEAGFVAILGAFALYFLVGMSFAGKQALRYVLVVFPMLDLVAAYGLLGAVGFVTRGLGPSRRSRVAASVLMAVGLVQAVRVFSHHPYYLAFQNEVYRTKYESYWGEGLEQVARWLESREDADTITVASFYPCVLGTFFDGRVVGLSRTTSANADYVVLYSSQVGRYLFPELVDRYFGKRSPVYVVEIGDQEVAWVYRTVPDVVDDGRGPPDDAPP